jgi:pectate lyase
LYVTSLEDDNTEGTLRWAINQSGPRIIMFKVSGVISLKNRLNIKKGDLTIAGQTAPGDGICIRNYDVNLNADNVIIRFIRFRMGDLERQQEDSFTGRFRKNIMIDHCSVSWSVDECSSFYSNEDFTLQWCIVAEALNMSIHEKADHGYGAIWGGKNASFHHNLLAHNNSRNPRFNGWKREGLKYENPLDEERVDYCNNVIYNWGDNSAYGGESAGKYNMVGNYYKPGPGTKPSAVSRILQIDFDEDTENYPPGFGTFYLKDNYMDGNKTVTNDNWQGVVLKKGVDPLVCKALTPFEHFPVHIQKAKDAYKSVLNHSGASLSRDAVDKRIVNEVLTGTATYSGSKTGRPGLLDSQEDAGGWPIYQSGTAPVDNNNDGIPDGWLEKKYPGKTANDTNKEGYTYLEIYLNSLTQKK